jgi:hypothetical protein
MGIRAPEFGARQPRIHGSTGSRAIRTLARGVPACLTVTRLDGLVLARSVFGHTAWSATGPDASPASQRPAR